MIDESTKVLIVDDMLMMRKLVERSIRSLGFKNIVVCNDGNDAWCRLNENTDVGLIISDWNMPVLTGIEFLKKVRADERFVNLPFVLLTAESERDQISEAAEAGVDNYILKPFSPATLKDKLEKVYKKRAA